MATLPDPVFAPLRSPARPLSTRSLRTLTEYLLCRALVVLIGAKTTLLQIPDTPRKPWKSLSSANFTVSRFLEGLSRTVVTFLPASPAGREVVAVQAPRAVHPHPALQWHTLHLLF